MDLVRNTPSVSHKVDETHAMPREGDYISITLNPADYEQYADSCNETRENKMKSRFKSMLVRWLKGFVSYQFCMEYSINGRLHFHGWIKIKDPKILLNSIYNISHLESFGSKKPSISKGHYIDVDRVDDFVTWNNYVCKDHKIMDSMITDTSKYTQDDLMYLNKNELDTDLLSKVHQPPAVKLLKAKKALAKELAKVHSFAESYKSSDIIVEFD